MALRVREHKATVLEMQCTRASTSLLGRLAIPRHHLRHMLRCTATQAETNTRPAHLCPTNDPMQLTLDNLAQWYNLGMTPLDQFRSKNVAVETWLPENLRLNAQAFGTLWLMCRMPFMKTIHYARQISPERRAFRVVLFGETGLGKTTTLLQAMHFGQHDNCVIVSMPNVHFYTEQPLMMAMRRGHFLEAPIPNEYTDGYLFDQPAMGVNWLEHFTLTNAHVADMLGALPTTKEYVMTERERISEGAPLTELIEFGKVRTKYSCDVIGILLRELRLHANNGDFKLMVLIDCANCMYFDSKLQLPDEEHAKAAALRLSIVRHMERLSHCDWNNGIVIMSGDEYPFIDRDKQTSHHFAPQTMDQTPINIFGEEGLKAIEPFITVPVDRYTRREFDSYMDHMNYLEWITNAKALTRQGRDQLFALTCAKPLLVDQMTSWM